MRVGKRKIPLRNLILIFSASHFTRRMSFQIFINMNLNISLPFMAQHWNVRCCRYIERCGKWRAKEIRNAFKRFFQHAISYRFFSSYLNNFFFLKREWNSNFSSSTCDQSFTHIFLFPGTTLDTYFERH